MSPVGFDSVGGAEECVVPRWPWASSEGLRRPSGGGERVRGANRVGIRGGGAGPLGFGVVQKPLTSASAVLSGLGRMDLPVEVRPQATLPIQRRHRCLRPPAARRPCFAGRSGGPGRSGRCRRPGPTGRRGRRPRHAGGRRPRRRPGRRRRAPGIRGTRRRACARAARSRSSTRSRRASPLGLEPRCVVQQVGRSFLGRQAGPAQLLGLDHPGERLAQVGRRPGIPPRVRPIVPAPGAVEPRQQDLEKLRLLDQMDGDQAVDPEPSIRSMAGIASHRSRSRRQTIVRSIGSRSRYCRRSASRARRTSSASFAEVGPEHAPALEIRRADLEPADDPGDPHLDRSPRDHRRQELRREGALLGGGQALERFAELLPEAHPFCSRLSVLECFDL